MNTIIFIGLLILVILLEAITDASTYLSWTKKQQPYGVISHVVQIVWAIALFLFGFWAGHTIALTWTCALVILLTAGVYHLAFFDIIRHALLQGSMAVGTTSGWDLIMRKIGINPDGLIWNFLKLAMVFGVTILLSNFLE